MEFTQKEVDQKSLNLRSRLAFIKKMGGAKVPGRCACGKTISANKEQCRECGDRAKKVSPKCSESSQS